MAIAMRLASLAGELSSISATSEMRTLVQKCLIDAAAAAAAAAATDPVRQALHLAHDQFGPGRASAWFCDADGLSLLGATFVNATAMSALDIDDGNRSARGHLSAAVIPAALAVGATTNASADQIIHAIVAGSEISSRLGASERLPFFASGRWAGVGAAVAAGILLGLGEAQLAEAIALSVHTAPLMAPAGQRRMMTGHIKEGVAFGAVSGVTAACLAKEGYRGDPDAVESCGIYDLHSLCLDESTPFAFRRTYFKLYACCRLAHSAIDAAIDLLNAQGLQPSDLASVRIHTFRAAIELPNEARPVSFESAQYSLPFCTAVAMVRGIEALLPLAPELLADQQICALADVVNLVPDAAFDVMYPRGTPTRVVFETKGGQLYSENRETANGDPSLPFSIDTMIGKFEKLSGTRLAEGLAKRIARELSTDVPTATDLDVLFRATT